MTRHLERLLQLDELIRSPIRQTCGSLAEALAVSERTIRSDFTFLRDRFDAPLEYDPQKGQHYTDPQWRLPTVPLSQGELFALTLGVNMLESFAGSVYEGDLRSSIQKLAERLPEKSRVSLQQLADERIIFRGGAKVNFDPHLGMQLSEACQQCRQVWMRYYAASRDAESERVIEPYLLHIYRGSNPYVIAFCQKRQAMRWFRVDRIRELRVLEETFERDITFNPQTYLEQIFQHEVGGDPVEVEIWFDAATSPFIRERKWHVTQEISEHEDGSLTLHMKTGGLNDLKRWVLGYGKGAVVKQPEALVALVREEIEGMNCSYQQGVNH